VDWNVALLLRFFPQRLDSFWSGGVSRFSGEFWVRVGCGKVLSRKGPQRGTFGSGRGSIVLMLERVGFKLLAVG